MSRELVMKVNVDVSEALTGLKAVQREAKEAVKALRELESAIQRKDGANIPPTKKYAEDLTFNVDSLKLQNVTDIEKAIRRMSMDRTYMKFNQN